MGFRSRQKCNPLPLHLPQGFCTWNFFLPVIVFVNLHGHFFQNLHGQLTISRYYYQKCKKTTHRYIVFFECLWIFFVEIPSRALALGLKKVHRKKHWTFIPGFFSRQPPNWHNLLCEIKKSPVYVSLLSSQGDKFLYFVNNKCILRKGEFKKIQNVWLNVVFLLYTKIFFNFLIRLLQKQSTPFFVFLDR